MVEIAESQSVFLINTIWCVHIRDDEWPSESIDVLAANVSMIPISTRLSNFEFVDEECSRLDRTLGYHGWSI